MNAMKEFARRTAPTLFYVLRDWKDQGMVEYRVFRRLRVGTLLKTFLWRRPSWQRELPLQATIRHRVNPREGAHDLLAELTSGATLASGGHATYLSPSEWRSSVLAPIAASYPPDAGLKLMRNTGTVADAGYLHGDLNSALHARVIHGHPHLSLVANLLYRHGLGPRLYDLTEIEYGGAVRTAYVSRHVGGGVPPMGACQRGIRALQDLTRKRLLRLVVPFGFEHSDFKCPECAGNAHHDEEHEFQFVDFQNFILDRYESFLEETADTAGKATHFGETSVLRGGRYLYQSVPGLNRPAKRDIAPRMHVISGMLASLGLTLERKIVLDVGCNIGMMMGQYLAAGAEWCHGWDMEHVVPHTENLLLAIGCTRFSLTGGVLEPTRRLAADLPGFVRARATGCVVSYLAIRGHIGWLPALGEIPWSLMIYEGHEGEDEEQSREYLAELTRTTGSEVAALSVYRDGDSDPRVVALVLRRA
jgi:hypothetical protein